MKARQLIEASTFPPGTLNIIFQAFDAAWSEIAHHFDPADLRQVEQARVRLAHACLIVAQEDSREPAQIKNDALQAMALAYRSRR